MSDKMYRKSFQAVSAATKILAFLLLEGIEHVSIDVTYKEVEVTAFVHDMGLFDEVRAIMKFGNYVGATYEEHEYLTESDKYMMLITHLPYKKN